MSTGHFLSGFSRRLNVVEEVAIQRSKGSTAPGILKSEVYRSIYALPIDARSHRDYTGSDPAIQHSQITESPTVIVHRVASLLINRFESHIE
jgi:hypothetical protein